MANEESEREILSSDEEEYDDDEEEQTTEDDDDKWAMHYSSDHQILLVGEGDFSFSLSLALSFGFASNICASSLDTYDFLLGKYRKARSNLETLKNLGALLLHGVDATRMKLHPNLRARKFDRIVFNFPHAGFHGKEKSTHLIGMHRKLVHGFFLCARHMLRANGEIHISHKEKSPFCDWNLEELAAKSSLSLIERVNFRKDDYPGYENKRGDGSWCDEPFTLGECSTFKFRFSPRAKQIYAETERLRNLMNQRSNRAHTDLAEVNQKQKRSHDLGYFDENYMQFRGYKGYEDERGDSWRCDELFILDECSTFDFRFSGRAKQIYAENERSRNLVRTKRSRTAVAEVNQRQISHYPGYFDKNNHLQFQDYPAQGSYRNHHERVLYPDNIRRKPQDIIRKEKKMMEQFQIAPRLGDSYRCSRTNPTHPRTRSVIEPEIAETLKRTLTSHTRCPNPNHRRDVEWYSEEVVRRTSTKRASALESRLLVFLRD